MRNYAQRRAGTHVSLCLRGACQSVIWCAVLGAAALVIATGARAADLTISVLDAHGRGVAGVVLIAMPDNAAARKRVSRVAIMDQINMQFVPNILVIQTGSSVDFPNSDQIQHQVYSFSAAKRFQLSLYAGHKYPPVLFDRPGLVTVGCNIHDSMLGYIYVTDSSFFGRSDAHGQLALHNLPSGDYTLTAWHPRLDEGSANELHLRVTLAESETGTALFQLRRPVPVDMPPHESKKWLDY
jgi:plastocyanin